MTIENQLQKWSEVISQSDNYIRNELDQLNRNITIILNVNIINQLSIYSLQQINLHLQLFLRGLTNEMDNTSGDKRTDKTAVRHGPDHSTGETRFPHNYK